MNFYWKFYLYNFLYISIFIFHLSSKYAMIETSFKKIFQEKDYIIMGGNNKEALQRENTIRFIEAAEELIDEQGFVDGSVGEMTATAGVPYATCSR